MSKMSCGSIGSLITYKPSETSTAGQLHLLDLASDSVGDGDGKRSDGALEFELGDFTRDQRSIHTERDGLSQGGEDGEERQNEKGERHDSRRHFVVVVVVVDISIFMLVLVGGDDVDD